MSRQGVPLSTDPEIRALHDHFDATLAEVSSLMNRLMAEAAKGDACDVNRAQNIAGVLIAGGLCLRESIHSQLSDKAEAQEDLEQIIAIAGERMVWTPDNPSVEVKPS